MQGDVGESDPVTTLQDLRYLETPICRVGLALEDERVEGRAIVRVYISNSATVAIDSRVLSVLLAI